jgi:GTP-binding protein
VLDQVFELFLQLNATDEQLDFPHIYCSAKNGFAKNELDDVSDDMIPLYDAIVKHIPPPRAHAGTDLQLLVANLDYSDYLGRISFGKVHRGKVAMNDQVFLCRGDGTRVKGKVSAIFHHEGMLRVQVQEAHAGDIVGLTGFEDVEIGETITNGESVEPLPFKPIDPPTISMQFAVNDGPLAGTEGKLVTARHIWERLTREIRTNIALRVAQTNDAKVFSVMCRGEMQIAILVEQMRREGFEVCVSRPQVIMKKDDEGKTIEPREKVFIEVPSDCLGTVLENLNTRRGSITNMDHHNDQVSVEAIVPTRGLIGFETDLVNSTRGMGVMSHLFYDYAPYAGDITTRRNGVLWSMEDGVATAYALNLVQERGRLFIAPGDKIYKGMIVGENARIQDMPVNPVREKHLTNIRSGGDGKGIQLLPPVDMSLERAIEYIDSDEYVEATPTSLRLRKKILDENLRKRMEGQKAAMIADE